jgi:selenide,water dikinase
MPIVDDPFDFGCIAATNALSDVYAMGGVPLLALAVVGMPVNKLPLATIKAHSRRRRVGLQQGAASRLPAGTRSTRSNRSTVSSPSVWSIRTTSNGTPAPAPGDKLILGKGLGVGFFSAALKKGLLSPACYAAMIASTTQLNTPGRALGCLAGVHAMTDVTGFGLLGHLVEICKASSVSAVIDYTALPTLPNALDYAPKAASPALPGATGRAMASTSSCRKKILATSNVPC